MIHTRILLCFWFALCNFKWIQNVDWKPIGWMGTGVENQRTGEVEKSKYSKHDKVIGIKYIVSYFVILQSIPHHHHTKQTSRFLSFPIRFHYCSFHIKNNTNKQKTHTAKWMLRQTPFTTYNYYYFFNLKSNNINR